jgi:regulatory protein
MTRHRQPSGSPSEAAGTSPAEAQDGDPEARARQICLRLLTISPKTRAQLATALDRRGIPAEAAGAVLARFADVGLIDDAAFARAWVESRHHSRGLSRRSLSDELRRKGIEAEEIREAVDALDPGQEIATARRLVERKLAGTRGQPSDVRIRRAAGTLARKGYPAGLVFRLIKEVMEQEGSPDPLELDSDQFLNPDDADGPGTFGAELREPGD